MTWGRICRNLPRRFLHSRLGSGDKGEMFSGRVRFGLSTPCKKEKKSTLILLSQQLGPVYHSGWRDHRCRHPPAAPLQGCCSRPGLAQSGWGLFPEQGLGSPEGWGCPVGAMFTASPLPGLMLGAGGFPAEHRSGLSGAMRAWSCGCPALGSRDGAGGARISPASWAGGVWGHHAEVSEHLGALVPLIWGTTGFPRHKPIPAAWSMNAGRCWVCPGSRALPGTAHAMPFSASCCGRRGHLSVLPAVRDAFLGLRRVWVCLEQHL